MLLSASCLKHVLLLCDVFLVVQTLAGAIRLHLEQVMAVVSIRTVDFVAMILWFYDDACSLWVDKFRRVPVFVHPSRESAQIGSMGCLNPIQCTAYGGQFVWVTYKGLSRITWDIEELVGWVDCMNVGYHKHCCACSLDYGWQLREFRMHSWFRVRFQDLFVDSQYGNTDVEFSDDSGGGDFNGNNSNDPHNQANICIGIPTSHLEVNGMAHTSHRLHLTPPYIRTISAHLMRKAKHHLRHKLLQSLEAVRKKDRSRLIKNSTWLRFVKRLDIEDEPCIKLWPIARLTDAHIEVLDRVEGRMMLANQRRDEEPFINVCRRVRDRDRARENREDQLINLALAEDFEAFGCILSNSLGSVGSQMLRLLFYILHGQFKYRMSCICDNQSFSFLRFLGLEQAHMTDIGVHYMDWQHSSMS